LYTIAEKTDIREQLTRGGQALCPDPACRRKLFVEIDHEPDPWKVLVALCGGCGAMAILF
jgi:hypothetical protein